MKKCKNCGHKEELHINPDKHVLDSTHCTKKNCNCKEFVEK